MDSRKLRCGAWRRLCLMGFSLLWLLAAMMSREKKDAPSRYGSPGEVLLQGITQPALGVGALIGTGSVGDRIEGGRGGKITWVEKGSLSYKV
ncbi:hypothetical protein E2C01_087546 [Portunus trituberculatus]|uniref:Uncharacterized protein n=1 Tax=Portunus trituberculatus TaxID=210409 RepID=A0A5B7JEB7_PORTR|nr:hypothetical protein [Portunus trituberculatus]